MNNEKKIPFKLNYGDGVVALPVSALSHLGTADASDLKTLLAIASDPAADAAVLSEKTGCRFDKTAAAIAFWLEMGVLIGTGGSVSDLGSGTFDSKEEQNEKSKKLLPATERPNYTGEEIQRLLDENEGNRRLLLEECQNIAEKIFNVLESTMVIGLSDTLGLDNEYIMLLFAYCKRHGKKSVAYVEKTAYNLFNEGVDTTAKLESYIKDKDSREALEGRMRTMFGWGDREITQTERSYIRRWATEFQYPIDIIKISYEIMINNTKGGKVSLPYMTRVMENWHENGLSTAEQIAAHIEEYKKQNSGSLPSDGGSFDTDEFTNLALKRSQEVAAKLDEASEKTSETQNI